MIYGIACFWLESLQGEFERYRVPYLRKIVGSLEIAGGLGLFAGYFSAPLRILTAWCLALLMVGAIFTRYKIRDKLIHWIPAIVLLLMNVAIAIINCEY